jgi:hypothetical protein
VENNNVNLSDQLIGGYFVVYQAIKTLNLPAEYKTKLVNMFGSIYEVETGVECTRENLMSLATSKKFEDYAKKLGLFGETK